MRVIELTIDKRKMQLFSFLKNNPTRTLKKDQFYKFVYFEPLDMVLTPYSYYHLFVNVTDEYQEGTDLANGWTLVRDLSISLAGRELLDILQDLEVTKLEEKRQGLGLELSGWLFDTIVTGLYTKQDTTALIKVMFLHGYSYQEAIELFTAIVKRTELASYFLEVLNRIYKGVEFG